MPSVLVLLVWMAACLRLPTVVLSFGAHRPLFGGRSVTASRSSGATLLQSSFAADGSEYSSRDSGDADSDDMENGDKSSSYDRSYREGDMDETATVELQPIPMSKNAGNRFVAIYWDAKLQQSELADEQVGLHHVRVELTEEHVIFCRKTNLYNETFNAASMVDVLWSFPILSSDLRRMIGHAVCLESADMTHVNNFLATEPLSRTLTDGDVTKIDVYRWRHLRDYTLRMDDGRDGFPCLALGLDAPPEEVGNLRTDVWQDTLEYWIRSERIIAAGPLMLPTEYKDDPSSLPVGDLVLFNAKNREDAVDFIEDMPTAAAGLYDDLRVHFYNRLDITGKFVAEDPTRDAPCGDLREAMQVWGYPIEDDQTPWLNW